MIVANVHSGGMPNKMRMLQTLMQADPFKEERAAAVAEADDNQEA